MKNYKRLLSAAIAVTMLSSSVYGGVVMADESDEVMENSQTEETSDDSDKTEDFISRLYTVALNRDYDEKGLNDWVDAIKTSTYSINQVAELFILSPEFEANEYTDEEYVLILYSTFMNRIPSQDELNFWVDYLKEGNSRELVLSGFTYSIEWSNICAEYGIGNISEAEDEEVSPIPEVTVNEEDVRAFVNRFYNCFLGRDADPEGMETWTKALVSGEFTACEVATGFIYSTEFQNSNLSPEEFIERFYTAFLNRESDKAGLDTWLYYYDYGFSTDFLISGFAHSEEFSNLCKEYGITRGEIVLREPRDLNPSKQMFVYDVYSALGRDVAPAVWNDTIVAMNTRTDAAGYGAYYVRQVFCSDEYVARNRTDDEFIQDLYTLLLCREATADEINNIKATLSNGGNRNSVIDTIIDSSEFETRCANSGVPYRRGVAPGYLSPELQASINSQVTDLRSAFNYAATMTYYRHDVDPNVGTRVFAEESFNSRQGNCYGMAAVFLELAKNLGYNGVQITGAVPSRRGGMAVHSWVELNIDGVIYVCDPDFTYGTGRDGLLIQYGQSGTWMYAREAEMRP